MFVGFSTPNTIIKKEKRRKRKEDEASDNDVGNGNIKTRDNLVKSPLGLCSKKANLIV